MKDALHTQKHVAPLHFRLHAEFQQRAIGTVAVFLDGELDFYTARVLSEKLDWIRAARIKRLIIDLSEVTYLDYTGISLIVYTYRSMVARRRSVVCVQPRSFSAKGALEKTKIAYGLPFVSFVEQADEAFESGLASTGEPALLAE